MALPERRRQELLPYEIARARKQRRRPCKEHGAVVIICLACVKRYCPYCHERCPACQEPPRKRQVQALSKEWTSTIEREFGPAQKKREVPKSYRDPRLAHVYEALQPMGIIAIEPHVDSGHWQAIFPMEIANVQSSEDLMTLVARQIVQWALPTPFGAGRMFKPDRRYATFQLK